MSDAADAAFSRAASRSGKSAMMRLRSASLMARQPAISAGLRPQPMQIPELESSVQICLQGEEMTDIVFLRDLVFKETR
jgi:hypothetical protein